MDLSDTLNTSFLVYSSELVNLIELFSVLFFLNNFFFSVLSTVTRFSKFEIKCVIDLTLFVKVCFRDTYFHKWCALLQ